ncbi:hypothetical protein EXIGLDRAFT_136670 [Exidia glandulosa HHB12029]|uniref:Uncharacterized protein n=1 Tax=Exidia glandulosa HHB12029 TaxID=1314781 RepID=A0A165G2S4_EXIGL|nr:hypothetical protein EXIGLDRAFT_136670 [Exidia glandulosa HHB12029]
MVTGCYRFALGLALRFGIHSQPRSHGLYIAEYPFIVLSPCAFIAAEYVLLGRLAHFLCADEHLLIRPPHITKVFVLSDLSTFLVQATPFPSRRLSRVVTACRVRHKKMDPAVAIAGKSIPLSQIIEAHHDTNLAADQRGLDDSKLPNLACPRLPAPHAHWRDTLACAVFATQDGAQPANHPRDNNPRTTRTTCLVPPTSLSRADTHGPCKFGH